jgi:UDP-GlcNAc:undecaprenyl-phosphate/decaprenyl-phosphate GlcNAc-1-phosphate transferase
MYRYFLPLVGGDQKIEPLHPRLPGGPTTQLLSDVLVYPADRRLIKNGGRKLLALTLAALLVAYIAAYLLTPLSGKLAHRLGVLDHPHDEGGGYKQHATATPYMGGLAVFVGLAVGAILLLFIPEGITSVPTGRYAWIIAIALGLGVVGLLDDVRSLPRSVRLCAQALAALGAWELGFRVTAAPSEWMNLALTILWIVGITNAFNLMDNMDGLLAGVAGIACLSFAAMGLLSDLPVLPLVAAALAGAAFGFLAHNRHPAKIFMGDAGSMFFGFLIALLGMKLNFENLLKVTFFVPVVVLALPIFDTTLVVLTRLAHRKGVFLGGRDHVSHRLVAIGLPVRTTVWLLYWCALCLGWLGIVISRSTVEVGWMLIGLVMALAIFFGALLWRVPVHQTTSKQEAETEETQERLRAVSP